MDELNELERLGLAFICGFTAGKSFEEAEKQMNEEQQKTDNVKVKVEKIEGKEAEKFINMMKEWGLE